MSKCDRQRGGERERLEKRCMRRGRNGQGSCREAAAEFPGHGKHTRNWKGGAKGE